MCFDRHLSLFVYSRRRSQTVARSELFRARNTELLPPGRCVNRPLRRVYAHAAPLVSGNRRSALPMLARCGPFTAQSAFDKSDNSRAQPQVPQTKE